MYRAELAREPKGASARQVREGLAAAEFQAARRAHTVLSYRRFLSEFPGSAFTTEARARLEALRWEAAESAGTEASLSGFLTDEPMGAHSAQAWEKLAAVRLQAALTTGSEPRLRAWLSANPQAAGHDRALAALDEAQFSAAAARGGPDGAEALRVYLADHPEGRHRAEAQRRLVDAEIAEAALLEDEGTLMALSRAGAGAAAKAALGQVQSARTLALEPSGGDPTMAAAARALFLPQPTSEDLAAEPIERARVLRSWAFAADGPRLGRLLRELGSGRAFIGLAALDATSALLSALPPAEARARSARLLQALRPKAQAASLLVAMSLLEQAAGHVDEALAQARSAAARDRGSLVAAARAAALETTDGEAPLALIAAQGLVSAAQAWVDLHADAARPAADRLPDATALLELCAARRSIAVAETQLSSERLSGQSGLVEARERAHRIAAGIAARLEEGEQARAVVVPGLVRCGALEEQAAEAGRVAVARRLAAIQTLTAAGPSARPALERARRRDPDQSVQQAVSVALDRLAASQAAAAAVR